MQCDLLWAAPPVGTTLAVLAAVHPQRCADEPNASFEGLVAGRRLSFEIPPLIAFRLPPGSAAPASPSLPVCHPTLVHLCHTLSNRCDQPTYGVANHKRPSSSGFCPEQMGFTWQLASKAQCNCMMQRVVGTSRRCIHTRCMSLPPPCCRGHRMLDREWTTALCRVLTCWHHAAPPGCHLQHILVV
jgi:hypothetical protein